MSNSFVLSATCGLLIITAMSAAGIHLPLVTVNGTHYGVGYELGSIFQKNIQMYYMNNTALQNTYIPYSKTMEGRKIIQQYISIVKENYPHYYDELRGMANGASIPLQQVLLMSLRSELSYWAKPAKSEVDACSDILVNHPDTGNVIIGHNEDADPLIYDLGYIAEVHIFDKTKYVSMNYPHGVPMEEHFIAFCYPGELPGNAFNHIYTAGISTTLNAIYPSSALANKTARSMLTRSLLSATTVQDMKHLVTNKGVGSAYGFSVNIGMLPRNNKPPEVWNIEVGPNPEERQSKVSIFKVLPSSDNNSGDYFHVNIYRRLNISQSQKHMTSSIHRTHRILKLPKAKNIHGVLEILGDTEDSEYPLYRTQRPTDDARTAATALYNLLKCEMDLYHNNPKNASEPLFRVSLR